MNAQIPSGQLLDHFRIKALAGFRLSPLQCFIAGSEVDIPNERVNLSRVVHQANGGDNARGQVIILGDEAGPIGLGLEVAVPEAPKCSQL